MFPPEQRSVNILFSLAKFIFIPFFNRKVSLLDMHLCNFRRNYSRDLVGVSHFSCSCFLKMGNTALVFFRGFLPSRPYFRLQNPQKHRCVRHRYSFGNILKISMCQRMLFSCSTRRRFGKIFSALFH